MPNGNAGGIILVGTNHLVDFFVKVPCGETLLHGNIRLLKTLFCTFGWRYEPMVAKVFIWFPRTVNSKTIAMSAPKSWQFFCFFSA